MALMTHVGNCLQLWDERFSIVSSEHSPLPQSSCCQNHRSRVQHHRGQEQSHLPRSAQDAKSVMLAIYTEADVRVGYVKRIVLRLHQYKDPWPQYLIATVVARMACKYYHTLDSDEMLLHCIYLCLQNLCAIWESLSTAAAKSLLMAIFLSQKIRFDSLAHQTLVKVLVVRIKQQDVSYLSWQSPLLAKAV